MLVGFAVLMWLTMIRPQQRRQRELAHMQSSLNVGDEVMLTSGVYGVVRELDEEGTALVEISTGVVIKVARPAIGQVVHNEAPEARDGGTLPPTTTEGPEEN